MEPLWKNDGTWPQAQPCSESTCDITLNFSQENLNKEPRSELGYDSRINSLRDCIDTINPEIWKKVRWFINNYDFIVEEPIINRAFYKYWEIIQTFNLLDQSFQKILCLAEAPGGFIQGTNYYYSNLNKNKTKQIKKEDDGFIQVSKKKGLKLPQIYSISLNKNHPLYKNYNLPSYNEKVIKPNVKIIYGKNSTGDITNVENIKIFKEMLNGKVDFITADGGFDEGNDFNNKEQLHYNLFFTEIVYCLFFLKNSGNFIVKFFDTFTDTSLDLLWLLANCFSELYIYKPYTSRPTNSEKYIICKGFLGISSKLENKLMSILTKIISKKEKDPFRLFNNSQIPHRFRTTIFLMNQTILNGQCHFLQEAITLCYDSDFSENFEDLKENMVISRKANFKKWKETFKLTNF